MIFKSEEMMNLRDCYMNFDGNYEDALGRLGCEKTVEKFLYKFLEDKSFNLLEVSMRNENYDEALRATHTLKGICQNLSFTQLYESSSLMTGALRGRTGEKAIEIMPQLTNDYCQIISVIEKYKRFKAEQY